MKTNTKERARTVRVTSRKAEMELQRLVGSCLLFEKTFYEGGDSIADNIAERAMLVSPQFLAELAVDARTRLGLRHVSLWLAVQLCRHPRKSEVDVAQAVCDVIRRADELTEIIALYWKQNPEEREMPAYRYSRKINQTRIDANRGVVKRAPLAEALKRGIAKAFTKFNEYQLAKYDRDGDIKLRDAMFLSHPKPKDEDQHNLWGRLINKDLAVPHTWETELSEGKDKRVVFTRLLNEKKLGYLALLKNIRNMEESGVGTHLIASALREGAAKAFPKPLPFQFVAAMKVASNKLRAALEDGMYNALGDYEKLDGPTTLVIDVSNSMKTPLGEPKVQRWQREVEREVSPTTRMEAAAALAILIREACEISAIFTFSYGLIEVPEVRGFELITAIKNSQENGGTYLKGSLEQLFQHHREGRFIVITDEQSHDGLAEFRGTDAGYLVNVSADRQALNTDALGWKRIMGFSERIVDYIKYNEAIHD